MSEGERKYGGGGDFFDIIDKVTRRLVRDDTWEEVMKATSLPSGLGMSQAPDWQISPYLDPLTFYSFLNCSKICLT
jgi:hypothetical protein